MDSRRLVFVVLVVLLVVGLGLLVIDTIYIVHYYWLAALLSLGPELVGAVIAYGLFELFIGRRQWTEGEKKRLIADMGSSVPDVAVAASEKLKQRGWLSDGSLQRARLGNTSLCKADLREADLSKATLDRANLSKAKLLKASLSETSLSMANLSGAGLSERDLQISSLLRKVYRPGGYIEISRPYVSRADLSEADFSKVILSSVNLRRADLSRADLSEARLLSADLTGAFLAGANLSGARLEGANLQAAKLWAADLQGVELHFVNLQWADFQAANLQGADLTDAYFDENTMLPDGTKWTGDTDLTRFTDPNHPDFWRSDHPASPAYRGKDGD